MSERGTEWYKREPRAFLEGVRRMSEHQIAIYAVVLDLIYDGGHQTLDDPKHIASYFGNIGAASVRRVLDELVELGKLERDGAFLTNKRARNQGKTRRELSEFRRNAGRLGGISSGKNRQETSENNALTEANAKASHAKTSSVEGEGEGDKKTPGASAPTEPAAPDPFEAFWRAYPSRDGPNPKKPAKAKFEKLVKAGADPDRIVAAARRLAAQHPKPTPYVPQAMTWLNQERFADDAVSPPMTDGVAEDVWVKRLVFARRGRNWSIDAWGPIPGQPGCRVPLQLLQPGDGEGWEDKGRMAASAPSRQFGAA